MNRRWIILYVLLIAWTWPTDWNPYGKSSVTGNARTYTTITGASLRATFRLYSDGTLVTYFEGTKRKVRPIIVDPRPKCFCCKAWLDMGMMTGDGFFFEDPDDWRESNWKWSRIAGNGCEGDSKGVI